MHPVTTTFGFSFFSSKREARISRASCLADSKNPQGVSVDHEVVGPPLIADLSIHNQPLNNAEHHFGINQISGAPKASKMNFISFSQNAFHFKIVYREKDLLTIGL